MDKNREPLTQFRWRKDADGYVLASDGKIVRRGGRMLEYDPAHARPALHRVFADILSQTWAGAENEGRELSDDPNAQFHLRGFDDMPSAMLAFVNEYGFLGSDRTGADADAEDLAYLYKLSSNLNSVIHWTRLQRSRSGLKTALANAGLMGEAIAGPSLRMVMARDAHHGRMQVHYEPESLYAWMWLRTADDMTNGVDWSGPPCLYCSQPMGRGPGAHRPQAKFCSNKHRTYFDRLSPEEQRKRRRQAKELARGQQAEGSGDDIG